MGRKYTFEEVKEKLLGMELALLDGDYSILSDKISYMNKQGYKFYAEANHIVNRGTTERCITSKTNPYSIENIKLWLILHGKKFVLVSETFTSAKAPLLWQCVDSNCGEYFYRSWNKITDDQGCSFCEGLSIGKNNCLAKLNPDLAKEWDYIKNYPLTPEDVGPGSMKRVWWKCKNHDGHSWIAKVSDRTRGTGCPRCLTSSGEKIVAEYLNKHKIPYSPQHKFKDCRNKRVLEFDFYLEQENLIIEYDGIQHYEPVKRFGGQKGFENNQMKDELKNNYACNNDIDLLRIPYWEKDNISQILTERLLS
jgi:hypothetical protein